MRQICTLICMFLAIIMIAKDSQTSYYKKKNDPTETRNIQLQEIEFHDSNIVNIVNSCIPEIVNTCKLQSRHHYVRMYFIKGNPTQIVMYPESLLRHFTIDFWERYRKEIIGYMYVDDMLVIIQGKKAKKYINRKKEFKVITIGVYPPSCESDWSYWQYTLTGNDVIKKKHITKTPHIF